MRADYIRLKNNSPRPVELWETQRQRAANTLARLKQEQSTNVEVAPTSVPPNNNTSEEEGGEKNSNETFPDLVVKTRKLHRTRTRLAAMAIRRNPWRKRINSAEIPPMKTTKKKERLRRTSTTKMKSEKKLETRAKSCWRQRAKE